MFLKDYGVALQLDARIGFCPRHQGLTTVPQAFIRELTLRSLNGAGDLAALQDTSNVVLARIPTSTGVGVDVRSLR